jgi:UDP-glucuronate decarboxylase
MQYQSRILVTGGAGFLGSHLCEHLIRNGKEVVCLDNYYTGSKKNIEHLMGDKNFEVLRHDVTFPLYVEVDEIYNLACPASPVHYQFDPVQTTKTSVHGAINMLGLAKRVKAKILQASTSEVYVMEIRISTRNEKSTGAMSILSAFAHAMMKASVAPRRYSSTIGDNTASKLR